MKHTQTIHGNLVEIGGLGLLITGDAGVGKTTLTLDLVNLHGAKFVADDAVTIDMSTGIAHGFAPNTTKGLLCIGDDIVLAEDIFDETQIADSTIIAAQISL